MNPAGTQSWHERLWRNNNVADIARGRVPNSTVFAIFGERQTSGAVTKNVLWETPLPAAITIPNSIQLSFVSSGTDARRFKMLYLDGDLLEREEVITLNNTTPVLTVATDIRFVNLVYSLDGPAARTVTATQGGINYAVVGTGEVQFNGTAYRVPKGKRLMLTAMYAGSTSASADARVVLKAETSFFNGDRFGNLGYLHPVAAFGLQDTTSTLPFGPFAVPEGEIVAMTFQCDKAAKVVGGFFGWVEKSK